MKLNRLFLSLLSAAWLCSFAATSLAQVQTYWPTPSQWKTVAPAQAGMDEAKLAAAVEWAKGEETDMPSDFSTQAAIFGTPLGPVPTSRAKTNGLILRHGLIVAEWGDTLAVDPTYSVAKSYLATILGLTIDRKMIDSVTSKVGDVIHDGGYDGPHNSQVTWQHHVTQSSEWQGELFGKSHTFIGKEAFGQGEMKPRELQVPGSLYEYNDVRINRFSLSMLRLWKRPLADVLKTEIMDPIGASDTWRWHPYSNSTVDVDGTQMPSVSGGTRWGGGLWISTRDHARFGLLMLRQGEWNGKQILSREWIDEATKPHGQRKDYGYLWWLNTESRWTNVPTSSYSAQGAGSNTIWIDPTHDLVVVWRWHAGGDAQSEFYNRIVASIKHDDAAHP